MILYTNKQSPRENYVCEMRIRDLRAKPKKRDSVPQCFVSRNMKRPGKCTGLFRETKRRRKSCFVSVVSFPTCFNSGPNQACIKRRAATKVERGIRPVQGIFSYLYYLLPTQSKKCNGAAQFHLTYLFFY